MRLQPVAVLAAALVLLTAPIARAIPDCENNPDLPICNPDPDPDPEPQPDPFSLEAELDAETDDEGFVPPPPPPLPDVPRDRMLAWVGLFGSPTILLICLVLGIHLDTLVAYALVAAFIGGFLYLVVQMPRGPQVPWDDGARI